ncbi:hypothetical protein CEXT_128081 [Caerostris extrusa]|uniref:Uncharacterized protein n=1 Tax=Caerostris extrusa TaxID=172846 RepID=A0AAV4P3F3_CAEEX|nr:hypothetical protein CEXT_128081 [Caerostris extrusa]
MNASGQKRLPSGHDEVEGFKAQGTGEGSTKRGSLPENKRTGSVSKVTERNQKKLNCLDISSFVEDYTRALKFCVGFPRVDLISVACDAKVDGISRK